MRVAVAPRMSACSAGVRGAIQDVDDLPPAGVGAGYGEDGPVGADHEAAGLEGFEDDFEVWLELGGRPVVEVGFGDHSGDFTGYVGAAGELADGCGPGFDLVGGDGGFGDVIEDEGLVGVAVDEADGFLELAGEDEDVVDERGGGEVGDAGVEVGGVEEVGRLGLDDVAEAFEEGVRGEAFEERGEDGVGDGEPAYYAADEGFLGGEAEEPFGLFDGLAGLDGDGAGDFGGGGFGDEVGGLEVAAEGLLGVVDPAVFGGGVAPEVVVGVDAHRH